MIHKKSYLTLNPQKFNYGRKRGCLVAIYYRNQYKLSFLFPNGA